MELATSIIPSHFDLPSFMWGALLGGLGAFATGFMSAAGKSAWSSLVHWANPPPPEPKQIARNYLPPGIDGDRVSEIRADKIVDFEHHGYRLVREPGTDRPLFRISNESSGPIKMFLMHKPDGER